MVDRSGRLQELPGNELMGRSSGRKTWVKIEHTHGQFERPGTQLSPLLLKLSHGQGRMRSTCQAHRQNRPLLNL